MHSVREGLIISRMIRIAILIDGGHVRQVARRNKLYYTVDLVEQLALSCATDDEQIYRILYYDCARYEGTTKLPVSGNPHEFEGSDEWLRRLSTRELFAIRRGVLKFRGWKPKRLPVAKKELTDDDFSPDFEQKGVDMRIGLDIATFSTTNAVDRVVLITGDTDCIPAMKYGRISGLQIALAALPKKMPTGELRGHADFIRQLEWPKCAKPIKNDKG